VAVNPQAPVLRAAQYDENATFGDLNAVFKYMIENHIRYSLSSPPLLKDIPEGCVVIDKTQARLYFNVNNTLKYIAMT
jgi:hypothetical protein